MTATLASPAPMRRANAFQLARRTFTTAGGRSTGPRLGIRTGWLIFAIAVVLRVAYVLIFLRHYATTSDADQYRQIATNVAHGHGFATIYPYVFTHPTAFRPPLYPLLLGGAFAVFGVHIAVAQALNIALGSAVVVLIALLAARIGGRRAGWVAAGITAIFPPFLANDCVPLSEPLGLGLMLAAIWALLSGRLGWAGVACGLLVLTRPSAQLLVPFLALVVWRQVGWRRAAIFVVTAVVVVTPWVIRNDVVFGEPVLVTSNGFNLAAIYSPLALQEEQFVDPVFDKRFFPLQNYQHSLANLNEVNLDATFRREGLRGIRQRPLRVGYVLWVNVRRLVDETWSLNDDPEKRDGRPIGFRHATLWLVWLVELAGTVGLIRLTRSARTGYRISKGERRAAGRLGEGVVPLLAVYFLVVSVAAVSVPRLRAPIDALLLIAIGTLAGGIWQRRRSLADAKGPVGVLDEASDVQPSRVVTAAVLPEPEGRVRET